jgi:phage terminase large subunit
MKDDGMTRKDYIVADCAEPKSIAEIQAFGFWIVPSVKGADSIKVGIDVLHRYKLNVTRRSFGLIEELNSYKYKKDRDGKQTNDPVDKWNHAIDAVRYFALRKLNIQRTGTAKAHYNRLD